MAIQKQLSVFLPNRPGALARACYVLSDNDIKIMAMAVHDTIDNAVVRVIVENPTKALLILEQEEYYVLEQDVVVLEVSTEKGELMRISQSLAEADINISYLYCTATKTQGSGCLVLLCDDAERANDIITK